MKNSKKIVTVQDISCYGQCSILVSHPVITSYGIESAVLPTAILSTHTGGFVNPAVLDLTDQMPKIIEHWKREHIAFDAIYTGYIGNPRQFDHIRELKSLFKEGGKLIVDPAMADHGHLYKGLGPDIVSGMKKLIQEADLILPNLTEAALLLDRPYQEDYTEAELHELCKSLTNLGPSIAILTGASLTPDTIGSVAYDRTNDQFSSYMAPKMPRSYSGTGDIFASIITATYLNGLSLANCQKEACLYIGKCIQNTIDDPEHSYGVKL